MTFYQFLILLFLFLMVMACLLLSRKDDKLIALQERVTFLEERSTKRWKAESSLLNSNQSTQFWIPLITSIMI